MNNDKNPQTIDSEKRLLYGFKDSYKNPRALLIIVNFNGASFIGECLNSIFNQTYKNLQVLVVDNNSRDESVKFIKENYPEVEVLLNRQNKGYGGAINRAVKNGLKKYGNIDYFGILNNDLRLDDEWLENLVNYGEQKQQCGILAGKMFIYQWPKYINSTGTLVNYFGSAGTGIFLNLIRNAILKAAKFCQFPEGLL
ncbi:hypothetical protein ES703_26713 [subsurface metagenome]